MMQNDLIFHLQARVENLFQGLCRISQKYQEKSSANQITQRFYKIQNNAIFTSAGFSQDAPPTYES